MAWFRTNRGVAAWLALFALACQLSFTFGHVHIAKLGADSAAGISVQTPQSPSQKDPAGPASDFCAICANISLASTLILPILAIILAQRLFSNVLPWSPAASVPASFDHRPFGARGPPYA